jgi:hypothetical protein
MSNGIGLRRVVFVADSTMNDVVGPVSVEDNGWVTVWDEDDPQRVAVMYPPHVVLLVLHEPASKDKP